MTTLCLCDLVETRAEREQRTCAAMLSATQATSVPAQAALSNVSSHPLLRPLAARERLPGHRAPAGAAA
jgi:hypothetical protein